jgi:lipoprotein-releasing system permease protein
MRLEDLQAHETLSSNVKQGSLADLEGPDVVAIGRHMADNLGVGIDDEITLYSAEGATTTMAGTVPRIKTYYVVAIFEVGMYEYDSSFIYMPLDAAQVFFKKKNAASYLEVMIDDPDQVRKVGYEVMTRLGAGYRVVDWQMANSSFFTAIEVERSVMFIILTLIILVAAFNIISGQIMLVKDKGRAIAILRTMGATRGMIMRVFLMTGASIGIIGTVAGFLLGVVFTANISTIQGWVEALTNTSVFNPEIYFLSKLPAVIDPWEVAAVVVMSLALTLLATVYPSWRAARLDPVEALRYE